MNVLFAGGGSGGHLYPALAIARAMVAADERVRPMFVGAKRGIERTILPDCEFPFELLDLHPLYRSQPWLNWRTVVGSAGSWRRIAQIAIESAPRALVATGGYAAGVALGVASTRRIPIVIQEQNSVPGLTVRMFAARAAQLHLGFPEALRQLHPGRATQVFDSGNPIAPPPEARLPRGEALARWDFESSAEPVLLVFGGSQGAEGINRVVALWLAASAAETTRAAGVRVIWATGPANFERYAHLASNTVRVVPYISPMADAYAAADFAVARAGAMTTAELAAWGIPTILIPLPTAAADHQTHNARALAADGASILIIQSELTPDSLGANVSRLAHEPALRDEMRARTLLRARPHAAQEIAAHILAMDCFK